MFKFFFEKDVFEKSVIKRICLHTFFFNLGAQEAKLENSEEHDKNNCNNKANLFRGRMEASISTLVHGGVLYTSVPCVSFETNMQIYNENMHMFMRQIQLQKTLNRKAKEFKPVNHQASQKCNYINVNFCYRKSKVLKQLLENSKKRKQARPLKVKTQQKMELNPLHYISSPDGYSTGSENKVTKKMRHKYEKLQEKGDPWWHSSDKEMEPTIKELECQVYPKLRQQALNENKEEVVTNTQQSESNHGKINYYDALKQEDDDGDTIVAHTDFKKNKRGADVSIKQKKNKENLVCNKRDAILTSKLSEENINDGNIIIKISKNQNNLQAIKRQENKIKKCQIKKENENKHPILMEEIATEKGLVW